MIGSNHHKNTVSAINRCLRSAPVTTILAFSLLLSPSALALTDLPLFGPKSYSRLKGKPTVYTDTFERCNPSNAALLRVTNGDSKRTRIKSGRIYVNGAKVASERDFKHKVPVFEKTITVKELNDLKIVLKSGHHGYLEKLEEYQSKKSDLERELQRLQELRGEISSNPSASDLEALLREIRHIRDSHEDHHTSFEGISRSLDDDDDDEDSSRDDESDIDSGWTKRHKAELEKLRKEVQDTIRKCGNAREHLDRAPRKKKDHEHERKKHALDELARVLRELDKTIAKAIERLEEIEKKIEEISSRPPSFIIVEIIGKGCDSTAPVLSSPEPADGSLLNNSTPRISVQYADEPNGSGIDAATVKMIVDGTDVTASASVSSSGAAYTPASNLPEGTHTITASVADRANNAASLTWQFTTDTIAPIVKITSHQNDGYVNTPVAALSGSIDDSTASVTVNGQAAAVSNSTFNINLSLSEGQNTIAVEAKDPAGNTGTDAITLNLDTVPPVVQITSHANNQYLITPRITVSGNVNEPVTSVTINGAPAQLSGSTFELSVDLNEGPNSFEVQAVDRAGNTGTATIDLTLDTIAPVISVTAPVEASFVNTPSITLSGSVTDANPETVSINGTPVQLINNSFTHPNFTITEGLNTITVRATDKAGNESTKPVTLTLDTIVPDVTISSPTDGLLTNNPEIAVSGSVSEEFTTVKVNTVPAVVTGQTYSLSSYTLSEGQNVLAVSATDRAGNTGTASVSVKLDSIAPDPPVITQLPTPSPTPVITVSGTAEAGSSVTVSVEKTGQGGPSVIGTVTASAQGTFSIADIALAEGINTFTATATDEAGNTSQTSVPVAVEKDTKPPVITVTAPANNSFTNQTSISVTGNVDEPVELKINGVAVTMDGLSFTHDATLVVGSNFIVISARDLSGNTATVNWVVYVDQTPPTVTITSPADGLLTRTSPITVSGIVSEASTTVSVNGIPAVVTSKNFSLSNFVLSEGQNTLTVESTDRAGNKGTATAGVFLDTQAPTVTVTAPSEAAAGSKITISSESTDNVGLSLVEILVNGSPVWSSTLNGSTELAEVSELRTQNSLAYSISPDAANGSSLAITAKAYDTAGNIGTGTTQVQITSGPTGPGYLQGEVYDDVRGLRLEGATADFLATDGHGLTRIMTLEDGSYYTEAGAETYVVTLSKPGFTSVERTVTVKPEKDSIAVDARLTPINGQQNLIDANGGKITLTLPTGGDSNSELRTLNLELDVPANALSAQADIRLTSISNQGLAGLLPIGWSPIAAVEVDALTQNSELRTENFDSPATLKVSLASGPTITASSTVTLVMYDTTNHQWVVQNPGTVTSDSAFILAPVQSTGQYALVLPDAATTSAIVGSPLSSESSVNSVAEGISASGKVVPPAAPAAIGVKAIGEVVISAPTATLNSGVIITGKVTERFDLLSGEVVLPSDYTQDLVLYRYPCLTNLAEGATQNSELRTVNSGKVGSTFPVTPSRDYTIIDLMKGKVGIEIALRQGEDSTGTMVGTAGARLLDNDGNVLVINENSLTRTVPVETRTIPAATLAGVVGPDFTLLRAADVNLSNQTLAGSAELSIPAPANVNASLPIVVAKAIEIRGVKKLKLVALARLSGSLIISSVSSVPSVASSLSGITVSGQYFFLQAKSGLGFVTGTVKDGSARPYSSAQVTTSTCSLTDLTGPDGRYLVASTVAGFTLTASDIYKNDKGTRIDLITAANETKALDVTINVTPPSVVSVVPANGAAGVDPKTQIVITMSEAVRPESVTSNSVILKDSSGSQVSGAFSLSPDGTVITLFPSILLNSETQYDLTVTHSVQDLQGYFMGQDFVSHFTIKDTTPPMPPAAGSITATFPDAEGYVTITATQGSAEPTGTILIINDTSGEIVSVKPASNGSFTGKIMAQLGDEIKIVSMDSSGNQTLITYITFKSDDGRYLVTAKGGIVEGDGGLRLEVPEGALLGPTVIKITPVTEDQLPQDNPVPPQAKFLAAVNIDTGGMNFQKEVKISVPKPSNLPADAVPFVAQPKVHTNADGTQEKVYVIHDSAKVVNAADGERLTTASPPFTGVWGFGLLTFLYPPEPLLGPVVISGYTYQDMDGIGGYLSTVDKPIAGAIIRDPAAYNFISYSDSEGHYAAYGFSAAGVCRTFATTAIHPQTMNKHTANITTCDVPYIVNDLNFKLADKDTQLPDRIPPAIEMNLQVVPGQTIPGTNTAPQFVAGTIPVGTDLSLIVNIQEQVGAPAPTATLQVSYKTPDMVAAVPVTGNTLGFSGEPTLVTPGSGTTPPTYKFEFKPTFSSTIAGDSSLYFSPPLDRPATYTLVVEATDSAGNRSTRTMTVRAIQPGTQPDGVDGKPQVDEIVPADGAKEIMVTMPVMVTFNEPVQNVNSETLKLLSLDYDPYTEQTHENPVDATVYTSLEGGRVRATLQPKTNLIFGQKYKIVVTTGITDSLGNSEAVCQAHDLSLHEGCLLPLNKEYVAYFTTKEPQIYDLDEGQFTGGRGIDLYTDGNNGKTYAYVTAGDQGYRIIDVTDPTNPTVVKSFSMSNGGVNWNYRGVDVDPDTSMLAMTEDIRYLDGNHYGYVRFYDLINNPQANPPSSPANPKVVGREKLAEAYSGVPMRISMMNNFAYIATVNIGLQVVDINAAKAFMQTGQQSDGSTIVGIFDTIGQGYKNPTDIIAYKSGKAAMTTTSGHLILLDINVPQFPQEMTAFKPTPTLDNFNFDSAWRVAVASDYAYTPSPLAGEGGGEGASAVNQVIDLAVTVSMQGRIHTVNITDPYNIEVMGVAKDGSDEVLAQASDITISKASGLVYITSGMSVYIIDIKDPNNPKLLNIVTATPDEPGSTTMTTLGTSMALVEKDGWVYLANQDKGLRVLDLDPVWLEYYRDDQAFPDSYYPTLGERTITLKGRGPELFDQPLNTTNNHGIPPKVKLVSYTPAEGVSVRSKVAGDDSRATFNDNGLATFYIQTGPTFENNEVTVSFEIDPTTIYGGGSQLQSTNPNSYRTTVRLKIMNNSKVTLEMVKAGEAMFVADGLESRSTGTTHGFDYVKEMLNQVVPRKRNLVFNTANPNAPGITPIPNNHGLYETSQAKYPYHQENASPLLIEEGGVFEKISELPKSPTSQALDIFRRNFRTGNTFYNDIVDNDASPTMWKILKNYGSGLSNPEKAKLLYQIVEKETLIGTERRIPAETEAVTTDNADVLLNGATGNARNDTCLYELYKNSVERFNRNLINLMESYERNANPDNAFNGQPGQWIPREGPAQVKWNNTTPLAVAYSYGGRQTISEFNTQVARFRAPNWTNTELGAPQGHAQGDAIRAYISGYRHNIVNPQANDIDPLHTTFGVIGGGAKRWTGLYKNRFDNRTDDNEYDLGFGNGGDHHFYFENWTGIDCNGLTLHGLRYAHDPSRTSGQSTYAASQMLAGNGDAAIPGVTIGQVCVSDNCATLSDIHNNSAGNGALMNANVGRLFNTQNRNLLYYWTATNTTTKFIRRGDLLRYRSGNSDTHISTVYSDGSICTETSAGAPTALTTCTYDIIHASGSDYLDLNGNRLREPDEFSRKVRTNPNTVMSTRPTGFGRIKLWD